MSQEQFNLNWQTYSDHLQELMQNLLQSNESADVTLVTEDKTKFVAHKFVLQACSPVLQSIMIDLPQKQDSVIFLKGIQPQELKPILQFMYLGQATLHQDRINEFLDTVKSLQIKELSNGVDYNAVDKSLDKNLDSDQTKNDMLYKTNNETSYDVIESDTKMSNKNEIPHYSCNECDKQFFSKSNANAHAKRAHEGFKFSCGQCKKTFTQKIGLDRHIASIHEGIKYQCDICDHQASTKSNLYAHLKNKHGI